MNAGKVDKENEPDQKRLKIEEPRATFPVMSEAELGQYSLPYSDDVQFTSKLGTMLKEHGMAVVTSVLDANEIADLEGIWKRELKEESALPWKQATDGGWWLNAWFHAHGEFAWKARLHHRVKDIFSRIYDTNDLACGLDTVKSFCVAEAPAEADNLQWLHVDQNSLTGITHDCYQSILYLWPSDGESRSTTVIWPGSHKENGTYGEIIDDPVAKKKGSLRNAYGVPFGHYLALSELEAEGSKKLVKEGVDGARRVPVPAGALLIWSSRTVHQGWRGGPRLAVPICYEPADRVSEEARQRKIFMTAAGFPSTHSPSEALIHPCVATRRGHPAIRMKAPRVRPFSVLSEEELSAVDWEKAWSSWDGEQLAEDLLASMDFAPFAKILKPDVLAVM
mmetsp:Transcript_77022/g.121618  ORF Transcript_77022/g.121618 Transcript_77022/m.121618 type:complete len:393 (-) Transcript_77022:181-1359(-)